MRCKVLLMALILAGCRSPAPAATSSPQATPVRPIATTPVAATTSAFPRPPPPQWTPGPGQSQSVPLTETQLKVEKAIARAKRMAAEGELDDAEDLLDSTRDLAPADGRLTFMLWSAAAQMNRLASAFNYGTQYRTGFGGKFTPEPDKLGLVDAWFKDHTPRDQDPDDE